MTLDYVSLDIQVFGGIGMRTGPLEFVGAADDAKVGLSLVWVGGSDVGFCV